MSERCSSCPGSRYLAPYGDEASTVAIVGEQPVAMHPDDSDHVFALDLDETQRSSEIIEKVFRQLELDVEPSDLYWTNMLKCVKVGNEQDCIDMLREELLGFSKVIVLGEEAQSKFPEGPYTVRELWHPAYLLRDPERIEEYVDMWDEALGDSLQQQSLDHFR